MTGYDPARGRLPGLWQLLRKLFPPSFSGREGLGGLEYLEDGSIFLAVLGAVLRVIEYFVDFWCISHGGMFFQRADLWRFFITVLVHVFLPFCSEFWLPRD